MDFIAFEPLFERKKEILACLGLILLLSIYTLSGHQDDGSDQIKTERGYIESLVLFIEMRPDGSLKVDERLKVTAGSKGDISALTLRFPVNNLLLPKPVNYKVEGCRFNLTPFQCPSFTGSPSKKGYRSLLFKAPKEVEQGRKATYEFRYVLKDVLVSSKESNKISIEMFSPMAFSDVKTLSGSLILPPTLLGKEVQVEAVVSYGDQTQREHERDMYLPVNLKAQPNSPDTIEYVFSSQRGIKASSRLILHLHWEPSTLP